MMGKTSLASCLSKNTTARNERGSRAERSRTRALRLEGLESRELLSVAPGSELFATDALAVYESSVATNADEILDITECMLDDSDVAPVAPEWATITAPAPLAASPTPLTTPTLTVEGKTGLAIAVTWNAVPNVERYSLSYKPSNSTTWTNKNVGTNTSYTVSGLALNTEYDIRLKAIGDGVNYKSVYSPIIHATTNATPDPSETPMPLATPTVTVVGRTGTTLTVSWGEVDNVVRYSFGYKLASDTIWTNKNVGTDLSYTITGLEKTTDYDVRVKAIGDGEIYKSVYSPAVRAATDASLTPLATPVLTVSGKTGSTITVNWGAVANVERYSLSYKPASATTWTNVNVGTNRSYTIGGLDTDTAYEIRLKAIADGVTYKSVYSGIVDVRTEATPDVPVGPVPLETPSLTVSAVGPSFLTINWAEVPNAIRYSFSYKPTGSTVWTNKNVGTDTSCTITGLTLNTEYDVRLKAIGDDVTYKSVYSPIIRVETAAELIPLESPRATAEATPTSVTVSWDEVPNAVRYGVSYRLAGASEWTNVNAGTNLSYTIEGLDPTTEYDVRIRAVGDGSTYGSVYSAVVRVQTLEGDWPNFTTIDASNDSLLLHWNPIPNAAGYYVAYAPVGSTTFTQKYVVAPTAYTRITGLSANTEYQLKIRVATYETTSEFSPVVTWTTSSEPFVKTALAAPTISARGIASDALYVEWEADPRATGYIVSYRERTASEYETINVAASETGLVLGGLDSDTSYYVRVKTVGDSFFWSSSAYSVPQTIKTQDASFLSTAEYEDLRDRYDRLLLPQSMADVNIVLLEDWSAEAMIDAIEEARSTSVDDVILLDPEYFDEPLDLSGVTITLDLDYATSGAISILSRGFDPDLDRAQIKVNGYDVTFDAIAGLTQFGGIDFVDVDPEVSVYQVTSTPALDVLPTVVDTQGVGAYTAAGYSVWTMENSLREETPTPSANPSEHDYALLFIGGSNPRANTREYYETLYDYYKELVEERKLDPTHIYILYADGDVSGTSLNVNNKSVYNGINITTSNMTFATDLSTSVRPATGSELSKTLREIADLMTADSHLLFWTYDHGDGKKGATLDRDDYLCGWSKPIDGTPVPEEDYKISGATVRDALFQIQQGYATCVFTQCFSGGILDDIFDPATGTVSSQYTGAAHFAGGAATNHYEVSWTSECQGVGYVGYAQTFTDAMRYCSTGLDAFDYTKKNDPFSAANPEPNPHATFSPSYEPNEGAAVPNTEHPWHAGEAFSIFTTSPEQSAPTITLHSSTTDSITLTWSAVPNATSYTLEYGAVGGSAPEKPVVITPENNNLPTSCTITGLAPARLYTLKVMANNSPYSPQTTVLTESGGVMEPRSLVVTTVEDPVPPPREHGLPAPPNPSYYDGVISLRDALDYAMPGDTITFDPLLLGKTFKLSKPLNVTKSVTIDASNLCDVSAQTPGITISGGNSKRIMDIDGGNTLTIKGVEFTLGLSSGNTGSAIKNRGDLVVENCVFSHNKGVAIAVANQSASLTALSTVFSNNEGSGAVFFDTYEESSFTNCVFVDNKVGKKGAVYDERGAVAMTNCVVRGNEGSGIYVGPEGNLTATNCLVVGNTAPTGAGLNLSGSATLYYCTVAGNAASSKGGGVYLEDAVFNAYNLEDAVLNAYNTIIAGNTATSGGNDVEIVDGSTHCHNVLTSLVTGWDTEEALYSYDPSLPLFNDAANGDYTLAENSQAIDKGRVLIDATVTTDLLGADRVSGGAPDLGAYEFQNLTPPLATPTNVAASSTTNSITVSWDAVTDASSYKVEYKLASAAEWTTWSDSVAATSATITNLTQGTPYFARVTAVSGDLTQYVNSTPSQPVSLWTLEPLAPPSITVVTDVQVATIRWTAVQNASGYALSYKESSEPDVASSWTVVGGIAASATSYTLDNLFGATQYDFKLAATGDGAFYADSAASVVASAIVKEQLETPTITVDLTVVNSATVSWTAVQNASSYALSYKKTSDPDVAASWTVVDGISPSATTVTVNALAGGSQYDFKLVAKGDGTSYVDSDVSVVVSGRVPRKLGTPTYVDANSGLDFISVSWNAVEDAVGYDVSYALAGTNDWSAPERVDSALSWTKRLSFGENGPSGGKTYDVRIAAIATGYDVNSDAVSTSVASQLLAAPTVAAKNTTADVEHEIFSATISWNPVDFATGYMIEYAVGDYAVDGNLNWIAPAELPTGTTWTKATGLLPNTTYSVRLKATADDYRSAATFEKFTITVEPTPLPAPTIAVAPAVNAATIGWGAVQNASSYALFYKKTSDPDESANWTVVDNIATPSYTVRYLDGATKYDFKVVAKGDGLLYLDSDASAVVTATIQEQLAPAPTISVTSGVNSATATWGAIQHASSYALSYKKTNDPDYASNWTTIPDISTASYTVDCLEGATEYDFQVVAVGDGTYYVNSEASAVVTAIVKSKLAPAPTLSVTPGFYQATASWTAVPNASSYALSYKKTNDPDDPANWTVVNLPSSQTSVTIDGLVGATQYDFKVVAVGDGTWRVNSDPSAVETAIVKSKLSTPTISVTPGVNQATVSWTPYANVSSYVYTLSYKKTDDPDDAASWTNVPNITGASSYSVPVTGLAGATRYDFKVVWKGDGTWYVDSDPAQKSAIVKGKLSTPTISSVNTSVPYKATVNWGAVANASSYTVYWKKTSDPDSSWVHRDNIGASATSYPVANLDGATSYDFKVVAKGDGTWRVDSNDSDVKPATVKAQLPAPTGLQSTAHTNTTISLSWNAVAHASSYTVQYVGGGQTQYRTFSSNSGVIDQLNPATEYTISVKANGDNVYYVDSLYSGSITQTTKETASVVVNSTADTINAYDGVITLREALTTYGAQGATVTFASNMSGQTINLNSQIALSSSKTINASALSSPVTISGQQKTRVFALSGTNQTFTITKVNFTQGKITSGGGGAINLAGSGAKLVLNNCAFTSNTEAGAAASSDDECENRGGGAIYVGSGARIDATNCSFTSNTTTQAAGHRGGAVHLYGSVGNFTACTFQSNKSFGGGAMAYSNGATGTVGNCLIVKNETNQRGGGVALMKNADVTFKNCTIVKNTATQSGSGVYVWNDTSKGTFDNCIVILNASTSASGHANFGYNTGMVTAPNIYGHKTLTGSNVTWKSGNHLVYNSSKALFVDENSNWHLTGTGSQACNVGNNDYAAGTTDLDGATRKRGGTVDLGCYEVQAGSTSALLDEESELFDEMEMEDSLDLIAASLLERK